MAIEYPYSEQAERATLGSMLVDEDAQRIGLSSLLEKDFYVPANRLVFECMKRIASKNMPIDITTVTDDLTAIAKIEEVGGVTNLTSMIKGVVTANIDYYIETLKEKTNFRDLLDLVNKVIADVSQKNIEDGEGYLDDLEKQVIEIARNRKVGDFITTNQILSVIKQKYSNRIDNGSLLGVPSGYKALDNILNGFQKGDLIILAARTSMGKTQLAINFAMNAARLTQKPIGFFSVEMPAEQIVNRMISTTSRLSSDKIKKYDFNQDDLVKFEDGMKKIAGYDIYFDETSSRLLDIQTKARKLKAQCPDLAFIVVDYLQMISSTSKSKNGSREQEVSELSRGIKNLARELNVPILCLAQLSRALEKRGADKRPMLSDLRESGAIEQDADVVLFIYRDDYYDHEKKLDTVPAEIIIAKNRNGKTDKINLTFTLSTGEFNSSFTE